MKSRSTKKMVLSGLFLALGLVMPFLTAQIPSLGNKLLPMHIPVFMCGFVCGWPYGLMIGLIVPVFRSVLFGMPPLFPTAAAMALELAAYGFMSGVLYKLLPRKTGYIFLSLMISMISGRILWGVVSIPLYGLSGAEFTWELFLAGALLNAIPGIVLQIVFVPIMIITLSQANLIENN